MFIGYVIVENYFFINRLVGDEGLASLDSLS